MSREVIGVESTRRTGVWIAVAVAALVVVIIGMILLAGGDGGDGGGGMPGY